MSRASVVKIIVILAFALLVVGFCAWTSDFRSESGSGELISFQMINNTHIVSSDVNLTKNGDVWVYVKSDRPVDILVMDRDNFTNYYATEQGNRTPWNAFSTAVNVTAGGLNYTAPADGDYLLVIDNTPLNVGGASGNSSANINVKYAYRWSHCPAPLSWFIGN